MGKTTGTFFAFVEGEAKGIRVTYNAEGDPIRGKGQGVVVFVDPDKTKYATQAMVVNLVANSGTTEHPIVLVGDKVSSARILAETHAWKTFLTIDEACNHSHLGKSMPSAETIRARYAERMAELEGVEG